MLSRPHPRDIRSVRQAAGITQAQAAQLVHLGSGSRWSEFESGSKTIDMARWELLLVKLGKHPDYPTRQG